jgi:hypothetical protein
MSVDLTASCERGAKTVQKMKLTDATIRTLNPSTNAYVWDTSTPAFGVYVGKNRKTFVAVRSGSRHKLGVYGVIGLAEARDRAKKHLFNGAVANRRISIKFTDAVDSYLSLREPEVSPGALREYTRHLRRVFTFSAAERPNSVASGPEIRALMVRKT